MNRNESQIIIEELKKFYGQPKPELNYHNLYELTISVILSAQTTDKQVNKVTPQLFAKYPDFATLSQAELTDVENLIKRIGLYKNKSKNIILLAQKITKDLAGKLPSSKKELLTLPGIGPKTSNVILNQGFNKPAFAVDTHVKRIANRLGYINSNDPQKVEKVMCTYILPKDWGQMHLVFITHGRQICTARTPDCLNCPIKDKCAYYLKIK